jgi:hypothetical protein
VHVERDANIAKFWLDPVRLVGSGGFRSAEIGREAGRGKSRGTVKELG